MGGCSLRLWQGICQWKYFGKHNEKGKRFKGNKNVPSSPVRYNLLATFYKMKYRYLTSMNNVPNKPHYRRPIVDVELCGPKKSIGTIALVDSGADYCLFNIEYAKAIGIDINKCEKDMTVGVEGGSKEIFMTELEIQVKDLNKVKVPVGFIDSRSVTGLIGQSGFFDLHKIKFERDHNSFEINPVK